MRKLANKPYGVRKQKRYVAKCYLANSRIHSCKEFILRQHARPGQQIHQCGFANICVSNKRQPYNVTPRLALSDSLLFYFFNFSFNTSIWFLIFLLSVSSSLSPAPP